MPALQIGPTRPPENSPAYRELTRRTGSGIGRVSRWTGRSCEMVLDGQIFFQREMADRDRYTQAGCTSMGVQPARRSIAVGGSRVGSAVRANWIDAWCCQLPQVVDTFEQYVASPEYKRRKTMGLVFIGAMSLGVAYLVFDYKKLGGKWVGEHQQSISFGANPEDNFDKDEE